MDRGDSWKVEGEVGREVRKGRLEGNVGKFDGKVGREVAKKVDSVGSRNWFFIGLRRFSGGGRRRTEGEFPPPQQQELIAS